MPKSYKDYCREAVARDPKTYGHCFNNDGSLKPPPNMSSFYKKKKDKFELPKEKDGWKERTYNGGRKAPTLLLVGTDMQVKDKLEDLKTIDIPKDCSRKEYKRIWMHNQRVKEKLKKLKEQHGRTSTTL